jgi:HK97 family phage portal protein
MRLFGFDIQRKSATLTLDQFIQRLEAAYGTAAGVPVDPESALQAPTVQACIRAIASTISTLPVHVYLKTESNGREKKELLTSHPVARLMARPNDNQDRVNYWLDATSWLMRYGNFYAFKAQGSTGPIRRLEPMRPSAVTVEQTDSGRVRYRVTQANGGQVLYDRDEVHHVRLASRDGVIGDSPIVNGRDSIALEIAAERFGASFFGNGAMPSVIFQYAAASAGHRTKEEREKFIEDYNQAFSSARGRFKALLLPKGIEVAGDPIGVENDKAQSLETRKHQRTVIAGFLGVPPQYVGDLDRATYNNAEQQSIGFITTCVLPYVRIFEAAMEHDLLTVEDRRDGVIVRFNVDGALRGDFKTRQEGLKIQREAGVINPNEWREQEGMNPRTDPGGGDYWDQGPSGQQPRSGTEPKPVGNGNGNGGGR